MITASESSESKGNCGHFDGAQILRLLTKERTRRRGEQALLLGGTIGLKALLFGEHNTTLGSVKVRMENFGTF